MLCVPMHIYMHCAQFLDPRLFNSSVLFIYILLLLLLLHIAPCSTLSLSLIFLYFAILYHVRTTSPSLAFWLNVKCKLYNWTIAFILCFEFNILPLIWVCMCMCVFNNTVLTETDYYRIHTVQSTLPIECMRIDD